MLIHPWDSPQNDSEWREWLASTDHFGVLAVNNLDASHAPLVVPTHFAFDSEDILVHLARPNPVWSHVEGASEVRLAVVGDYAYVPSHWRAPLEGPSENGVPTSYYASVQFICRPTVIDDPEQKVELLRRQLSLFQPEGGHAPVSDTEAPYARLLPGIRGLRLHVVGVDAKFKYDDAKPIDHRERVSQHLSERNHGLDSGASAQQQRRLSEIGEWSSRPERA